MAADLNSQQPSALFDAGQFARDLKSAAEMEKAGQAHGAVSDLLRGSVKAARADANLRNPHGSQIAARLAANMDSIINALFAVSGARSEDFAICAVGGYGRGALAPFSDIDLLILYGSIADEVLKTVLDFLLYSCWDGGLKMGHAVHTPKSAISFVREDIVARTAYLDARFLCGNKKHYTDFKNSFDLLRLRTKNQFVSAKLKEQDDRQTKAGKTRYLVEPDVKEGKGALRDIQTLHWIYQYAYGGDIGEHKAVDKILGPGETRALAKAERFFWSIRVALHNLRGRADEKLSFDIQPHVAEHLGYAGRQGMTAADRLMKHYFINAVEVGRLTRILCSRLEEDRTKRLPHLPKFLPKKLQTDEAPGKVNLRIRNGRLDFQSAAKVRRQPVDMFRYFRGFSKQPKIDFHPDALALIAQLTPSVTSEVRRDAKVAKIFRAILTDCDDPVRVLRVMTETGLLGKYLPIYGQIVGRIRYGLYRRFTLDEHVLRCVGAVLRIARGELEDDHPISTRILKQTDELALFLVSALLRESIWTDKDRSMQNCEKKVVNIAKRLGFDSDQSSLIGWAAAHHSMLIRTAERRDLSDFQSVMRFAESVKSDERLDLMLVLCVAHLRVVGVNSWDDGMRSQLTDLYQATSVWFEGGKEALANFFDEKAADIRTNALALLDESNIHNGDRFIKSLDDRTLRTMTPEMVIRFANLEAAAQRDSESAAVLITPRNDELEVVIYADDRPGLFADLTSEIAARRYSVRSVHVLTSDAGKAFDVFVLKSSQGASGHDAASVKRFHAAILNIARGGDYDRPKFSRPLGDRRSIFEIRPSVEIDEEASEDAVVFEAEGLDRPGLLYELAAALSTFEVSVRSAHIATYGERAVDAFYLSNAEGGKIDDEKLLKRIEKRLLKVLSSGSAS